MCLGIYLLKGLKVFRIHKGLKYDKNNKKSLVNCYVNIRGETTNRIEDLHETS